MRALFALLLLANAAFAGWLYYLHQQPPPQQPAGSKPVPGAQSLVLLSERTSSVAPTAPDVDKTVTGPAATEAVNEQPVTGSPVVAGEPDRTGETAQPAPAAPQPAVRCYTLGPFRELDRLREIIRELKSDVLEASFRSNEEKERSLFWVYLKPEADHGAAKRTTRRLRQKNIRDSYIIAEGKNRFGISLGHFRDKSRAYRLRDKVAKLGFRPVVEPVFRSYTLYWLDYKTAGGSRLPALLQGDRLGKSVSRFDRACP